MSMATTIGARFPHGQKTDPCFAEVLLLLQGGALVDESRYAHTLTNLGGVTANVTEADFPSGKGINFSSQLNVGGLQLDGSTPGAEWNFGSQPVCIEAFVNIAAGALATGNKVLYNDNVGLNGNVFFISITDGRLSVRLNSLTNIIAYDGRTPLVPEGVSTYVCTQIHADRSVSFWCGPASDTAAAGGAAFSGTAPTLADPVAGPFTSHVGSAASSSLFTVDQLRITLCDRYADAASIPIPKALFPEH